MDWAKQSEEMMKTWTETQTALWNNWVEVMQQTAGQNQAAVMWKQTVDTWEKTVNGTLDAQAEWIKMWADNLEGYPNMPPEVAEWTSQTQDMIKYWGETQRQMWQGWFNLMKNTDPPTTAQAWGEESQKAFAAWQESAQKMMDAQMKWASKWSTDATKEE